MQLVIRLHDITRFDLGQICSAATSAEVRCVRACAGSNWFVMTGRTVCPPCGLLNIMAVIWSVLRPLFLLRFDFLQILLDRTSGQQLDQFFLQFAERLLAFRQSRVHKTLMQLTAVLRA